MPDIAGALKAEITRLARKAVKDDVRSLRSANGAQRRAIAALKRTAEAQAKQIAALRKKSTASEQRPATNGVKHRFSASHLKSMREKMGLSQEDMGKLVGVSAQSIYNWERGVRPRPALLERIAAVRSMGKREAQRQLAQE